MFEVADLAVASPATVSRCGMVYLEPSILGLQPFVECWLKKLPDAIYSHRPRLEELFTTFLEVSHTLSEIHHFWNANKLLAHKIYPKNNNKKKFFIVAKLNLTF